MIDEGLENWKRALAEQCLRRAHDIHVRDAKDLNRVGTVTVYEFLIDRIRSGVTHRIILMGDQSSLLPIQFHGITKQAERPARPWDLGGRQL